MEKCPGCGKSFPDGELLDVFITKGGKVTQQLLCRSCGLKATQGLQTMEIKSKKPKPGKPSFVSDRDWEILSDVTPTKKWWQFWKK